MSGDWKKNRSKRVLAAGVIAAGTVSAAAAGCTGSELPAGLNGGQTAEENTQDNPVWENEAWEDAAWEEAETTPLGKYPELVTYTLGKVTAADNSNMPEGDTYEDNNYTRYLRKLLNVQNEDVVEAENHTQYQYLEEMTVASGELPDIMIVTSHEMLDKLVENDLIEDLTEVYENCASSRIKEMYDSYGVDKLGDMTYDGKLMAFPETEVYTGPSMMWMRKDWIDALELDEPETLEEALEIVRQFTVQNPGGSEEGNVGIVFDPSLVGKSDQCFSLDVLFDHFHAYPQKWVKDSSGSIVNGSVTEETKQAIEKIAEIYRGGVF